MNEKTILFVYRAMNTFIEKDIKILRKNYWVIVFRSTNVLKDAIKLLLDVCRSDLVFVWFAGTHAFLPVLFSKIFGKKSIVIAGGYDTAKVPEIDYGVFSSWRGVFSKFVYKHADRVLVVDESLKGQVLKNTGLNIADKIFTVHTGFDSNKWKPKGKKEKMVLTVAYINHDTLKRKGLETFVKVAGYMPDVRFVLVGKYDEEALKELKSIGNNVEFTGFIPEEMLLKYYQRAKVYCQLSRYEGLPTALCEAMLCECVPVGTRHCGIPHAIGNTGFYVPYTHFMRHIDGEIIKLPGFGLTSLAIRKALESSGKDARERIRKLFPSEKREKLLSKHIEDLNE